MENMLSEDIRKQVREMFAEIDQPVDVLFFGTEDEASCQYCKETSQLLEEVTSLSDKLSLKQYDLDKDSAVASQYKVDAAPTFVLAGRDGDNVTDYAVRFKGIPAGHEFSTLVNALVIVSKRDSGLSENTRKFLAELKKPVKLEVFATPT